MSVARRSVKFLILVTVCVLSSAHAANEAQTEAPPETVNLGSSDPARDAAMRANYDYYIGNTIDALKKLGPGCDSCATRAVAGDVPPPSMCEANYKKLDEKPVIDMRVVLGYDDVDKHTEDGAARSAMIERLMAPCEPGHNRAACGFTRPEEDSMVLFEKVVDGHTYRLQLANSSFVADEAENTTTLKDGQAHQTNVARKLYMDGLKEADVLVYAGHGRNGYGPSFGPPEVIAGTLTPNLKKYLCSRLDSDSEMSKIVAALKSSPHKPAMMGMFICNGDQFADARLRAAAPDTGIAVGGAKEFFESGITQAFAMIDSTIAKRCEPALDAALSTVKEIEYSDGVDRVTEVTPVHMNGFASNVLPSKPDPGLARECSASKRQAVARAQSAAARKPAPSVTAGTATKPQPVVRPAAGRAASTSSSPAAAPPIAQPQYVAPRPAPQIVQPAPPSFVPPPPQPASGSADTEAVIPVIKRPVAPPAKPKPGVVPQAALPYDDGQPAVIPVRKKPADDATITVEQVN